MVSYLQLAHNERHPVTGSPVAKVIHNFRRADQVDRAALGRPVDLVGRFLLDCLVDEERLRRHDLSDAEWARLEPLLPRHPRQGHRWNDRRLVINGVFFRTRTGCPWRDLPERFGNCKTVYNRHRGWSGDGTWEMILDRLRAGVR